DTFGLGSGVAGYTAPAGNTQLDSYAQVTGGAAIGSTVISIGSVNTGAFAFAAGRLVLFVQNTGVATIPASGDQTTLDLTNDAVGHFELARLTAATATQLTLSAPLISTFTANDSQVVTVPEF